MAILPAAWDEPHFQMEIESDPILDYDKATLTQSLTCNTENCDVKKTTIWYLDKERLHQYPKSMFGSAWKDGKEFQAFRPVSFKTGNRNWELHQDGRWIEEGVIEQVAYPFASFLNDLEEDSSLKHSKLDESQRRSFLIPIVKTKEQVGKKVRVAPQYRVSPQQAQARWKTADTGDVNPWENQENRNDPTLYSTQNRLINWCKKMPNLK